MQFTPPLVQGTFLRRYKRFLVDVAMPDGTVVVAHSTNTGSLAGCLVEGAPVMLAPAANPERKLQWTWIMIQTPESWVGVDTSLAVPLVEGAMAAGALPELTGYERHIREVVYGEEGKSRIDILLSRGGREVPELKKKRFRWEHDERVYVEVKNTTFMVQQGKQRLGAFPDAVTERGLKHLFELAGAVRKGHRAAVVFCVQRSDVEAFVPADAVHPEYGAALRKVTKDEGVEAYALCTTISPTGIALDRRLEIVL